MMFNLLQEENLFTVVLLMMKTLISHMAALEHFPWQMLVQTRTDHSSSSVLAKLLG